MTNTSKAMAAATTTSSMFSLFSDLPPELRDQIWRDALPEKLGPGLYFYKKGCWRPRRLTASDVGYDPVRDDLNLVFEFRHDLLDATQFEMPLAYVNREARGIALAWIREQDMAIRPRDDKPLYPIYRRSFDPMRDALYIPLEEWENCLAEPYDRMFEPDLINRNVDFIPDVKRIAVSEALLRREAAALGEMFHHFFWLKVLFIVIDPQPDLQPVSSDGMEVQQRWEFVSIGGGAFVWDEDRGRFDFRGGDYLDAYKPLYTLIEKANEGLGEDLVRHHMHNFEIRLALAIRK